MVLFGPNIHRSWCGCPGQTSAVTTSIERGVDFVGRTLEQERGNGWLENVHPEDFDRCLQIYVTCFDARRPFQMEYRLRHRSGEYRWILDSAVPRYASDGAFEGYVGGGDH